MNKTNISIASDRNFNQEMIEQLKEKYPNTKFVLMAQHEFDHFSILSITIGSLQLIAQLVNLAINIKRKNKNSKAVIEIRLRNRKLKIDLDDNKINVNKLIEKFLESAKSD
ncbi:MAG: hypothetical protein NT170_03500 [Candidatus Moranbacteria bacterium]|nr:hypothetical protein [Candidatus Moranbacteria bacterium]